MKALKIILISVFTILISLYLAFLFVLPNRIDLNQYAPRITKTIQDNTGFQVELKDFKVKTFWNLSAGALINKTDLKYPTGKKFAQINGLNIKLSLLSLLFNNIKIDSISADKVLLNVETDKNGRFLLEKFLNYKKQNQNKLRFSDSMPTIVVKKYRISLINADEAGDNKYSLKGDNLAISNFFLNKKIKIKTKGDLILEGRKQISYDVSALSKILPNFSQNSGQKSDVVKIFEDLYKYNLQANVKADLKIKDDFDINGKINLNDISFTIGQKTLPNSDLKLDFNKDKVKIDSDFYTDINSKATISGVFKNGKHRFIDLKVTSDKIDLENTFLIAKTLLKSFDKKSLNEISADGFAKANFFLKSDFKKIHSQGYLQIIDANIKDRLYNVALNSVNADIDFSQDAIHIKKAKANLDGQPINIKGIVDKNANADILLSADNLNLKSVLLTSGHTKTLKENNISGIVNVKASLKGRLDKINPKIDVNVCDISLKNKKTDMCIKIANALVKINHEVSQNAGKAELNNLKIISGATLISAPKIQLNFDDKNLNIEKNYIYINNIKTTLIGKVLNINSAPYLSANIKIPNQISTSLAGCPNSLITVNGGLVLSGDLNKPEINGSFDVPVINVPSSSFSLKNAKIQFDKDINIKCPQVKIANSSMSFTARADKPQSFADMSKLIISNVDFAADNIDLNTLIPIYKNLPKNSSGMNLTILNGKNSVKQFRVGRIVSNNITSNISLKDNILYLTNLRSDAYFGKMVGDVGYDFGHKNIILNLQGRGMSANTVLTAVTGKSDDIYGKLDFDSNITMSGFSKNELLRSLNGYTNFIIKDGKMSALGKFEHLLYAQNIISNSVFKATLNVIAKAVTVKNTGVYKYMKGKVAFSNGWANINWIKTSGPSMSLYMTGRCYLPDNIANLIILGRISDDVVRVLGPIGEFSVNKAISYIPKIGEITSFFASQFTTNPNYENTSMIPYLTPKTEFQTKEFKVVIDGDIQKQSSVRSFKWISAPIVPQAASDDVIPIPNKAPEAAVPDFVKNLPDLKN